ncbi:uncharacterized protein A4U43_C04F34950 [Asparagus officinalis]|uniref:Armadillo-like repeats domain-containing protein n=1 Tax=Asparagus officinalis TaxID=4686 RepID=A0A5P1F5T9_ASPOF|nr:uncharacterized protein LOC109839627 [Asparagus officinalis]ONK73756.1 uncharacterized protein A4U43_C04F34950 [Asparagus officinalis]
MASSSLLPPLSPAQPLNNPTLLFSRSPSRFPSLPKTPNPRLPSSSLLVRAKSKLNGAQNPKESSKTARTVEEEEEVEEDLPWIQEKALDLVEFTGTVTQAIPGPRVGRSPLPWVLAVPLAYVGLSFVVAVVKTVKKLTSPKAKKKRLVNKNAFLLREIDELFQKGRGGVSNLALKGLMQKTGFSMDDILRKYIRYALNEKPFNPDLVVDLIHLRNASMLEDPQVAEVLNETSRRIVKEKGPVVMDISGFTEKGFKRKLAVQALFGKILYLSELPEFCSRDSSLIIKEIFGVTDEDADTLRMHTLSENSDMESLEKMVDDHDEEEADEGNSDQMKV